MAVRLRELCPQVHGLLSDPIAGRKVLDRPGRWVHMVGNVVIAGFPEGSEIAFTTGIGLSSQDELLPLVMSIDNAHASGIVINVGPFIHQIPQPVIQYCNDRSLPLFEVPWSVHMAEIMHQFCLSITMSDQTSIGLAAAVRNAILSPEREDLYMSFLQHNGFLKDWAYTVAVLCLCQDDGGESLLDVSLGRIQRSIDNLTAFRDWRMVTLRMGDELVLVGAQYTDAEVQGMVREVLDASGPMLPEGEDVYVGIGKKTRSARCIGKSYLQAMRLARLGRGRRLHEHVQSYVDMGMMKLPLSIGDEDVLRDFYQGTIAPIALYDNVNGTALVSLLKAYLAANGSVRECADKLFIHRNTVTYKIRKIEDIVRMDLSDFHSRACLSIGFDAYDILQFSGKIGH